MPTASTYTVARSDSPDFNQLVADASPRAHSVIEPLGFSVVSVGMLTPLGVVPVVTLQRLPRMSDGMDDQDRRLAA